MSRRRFMGKKEKNPLLVKLTGSPGNNMSYTLLDGYKYVDMLVVGGGGAGGYNSGGGGASGTLLYVKNFIISNVKNKTFTYNIAASSSGVGNSTTLSIDGKLITVTGGQRGLNTGWNGGDGGSLNDSSIIPILSAYVSNSNTDIAIANNGGGAGGAWSNENVYGYTGGCGASMSSSGTGTYVTNNDGTGGYNGSNDTSGSRSGGVGYRRNNIVIPIKSVFGGGGYSGELGVGYGSNGAGSGGGAAGYSSGGDGGKSPGSNGQPGSYGAGGGGAHAGGIGGAGAPGIICLYYHN